MKKCRELIKEYVENSDVPAIADENGDGEHTEWNKIAFCSYAKTIGKPLRHPEDYLNKMLDFSTYRVGEITDHTSFCNWEKEISMRILRSLLHHPGGSYISFQSSM